MKKPDPIIAAIEDMKRANRASNRAYAKYDRAQDAAAKTHGRRPWSLIAWREYSAIGGHEINDRRKEFLVQKVAPPERIEAEYRDAKKREREAIRSGKEWDKRAGVEPLRADLDRANAVYWAAVERLTKLRPTSAVGASHLISCVLSEMAIGDHPWHQRALRNAAAALAQMK